MKPKKYLSLFIVVFIAFFSPILISQNTTGKSEIQPNAKAQNENNEVAKVQITQISKESNKESENITWRDILDYSQRSNEKTLNTVILIVGAVSAFATILAVAIAIVGYLGVRKIELIRKETISKQSEIEKSYSEILAIQNEINKSYKTVRNFKKNIEESFEASRRKISEIDRLDLDSQISNSMKRQLDEFSKKSEIAQAVGIEMSADDFISRGNDLYIKNLYQEAKVEYVKALELKPHDYIIWFKLGYCYLGLQDYNKALTANEKAIDLKPGYQAAWLNKGTALSGLGFYEEALASFSKAIELGPTDSAAWYQKAICLSFMKIRDESIKALAEAIRLDPKYKNIARDAEEYEWLWDDYDFKILVG